MVQPSSAADSGERTLKDMETHSKPFRPPVSQLPPWLVFFSHGKRGKTHAFFSIVEERSYVRNIPQMARTTCKMYAHGWLLMTDWKTENLFLLNPLSMEKIQLPPLPPGPFPFEYPKCIMSSSPTQDGCVLLFADNNEPVILYCILRENKWIKMQYTREIGSLRDIATCRDKIYGITFSARLVVLDFDPNLVVRLVGMPPPVVTRWGGCRIRLVESDGEFYVVYLIGAGLSALALTIVVFKADISEMKWVQVQSIGNWAFFLCKGTSLSCPAANESGFKRDSIYYVEPHDPSLYRFDMADRSFSVDLPCPNLQKPWYEPHWVFL